MEKDGFTWESDKGCPYLVAVGFQTRCGVFLKADEKTRRAMTEDMGIGAGCSSTLFNSDRERVLRLLRSSSASRSTSSDKP